MNRLYFNVLFLSLMSMCSMSALAADAVLPNPEAQANGDKMHDARTVTELRLHSGSGDLSVDARTVAGVYAEVAGQSAVVTGKLFALAIDTGNDASTGKSPTFARDVKGAEWLASVEVCALEQTSGSAAAPHCVHGFWARNLAGASARTTLKDLAAHGAAGEPLASEVIAKPGASISIKIPYTKFGAQSGDTIQVHALGSQANGMFGPIGTPVTLVLD